MNKGIAKPRSLVNSGGLTVYNNSNDPLVIHPDNIDNDYKDYERRRLQFRSILFSDNFSCSDIIESFLNDISPNPMELIPKFISCCNIALCNDIPDMALNLKYNEGITYSDIVYIYLNKLEATDNIIQGKEFINNIKTLTIVFCITKLKEEINDEKILDIIIFDRFHRIYSEIYIFITNKFKIKICHDDYKRFLDICVYKYTYLHRTKNIVISTTDNNQLVL